MSAVLQVAAIPQCYYPHSFKSKLRSGGKKVLLPNGRALKLKIWDTRAKPPQLALARDHRWMAMLESGKVKSLKEIAERENIDNSYVSRIVNSTCLPPDIVTGILEDEVPETSHCLSWR